MVLTNAHLIFYKHPKIGQRQLAYKMFVSFTNKKIKVANFKYCPKFFDHKNSAIVREYDVGLLLLEEQVNIRQYLLLGEAYSKSSRLYFPKIIRDYKKGVATVQVKRTQEVLYIYDDQIFKHNLDTQPGDSGTPIIILHENPLFPQFCIIAIHASAFRDDYAKLSKR